MRRYSPPPPPGHIELTLARLGVPRLTFRVRRVAVRVVVRTAKSAPSQWQLCVGELTGECAPERESERKKVANSRTSAILWCRSISLARFQNNSIAGPALAPASSPFGLVSRDAFHCTERERFAGWRKLLEHARSHIKKKKITRRERERERFWCQW